MILYTHPRSGNGYKVSLLLSLLKLPHESIFLDFAKGEHKTAAYLAKNPRGQVPVLEDGAIVLWESQSILAYLARRAEAEAWFPQDPAGCGLTIRWLSFSGAEIDGLADARRVHLLGYERDLEKAIRMGAAALAILNAQLEKTKFLVGDHPTIADVACYPYVAMAHEGKIDIRPYANVDRWVSDIETLPGYIPYPGKD
ncbi:MAG: glutathione S-transferase family protein [Chloroflexota bacterium]